MGIISLRCRVSAASGGASPAAGGGVLVTPCRCRAILFSIMIIPLVYEPCNPHWAHRAHWEKFLICVEQAGMSNLDIPVFCVSQVAGRYCVAVKKGDTKIVLFVNLIVQ